MNSLRSNSISYFVPQIAFRNQRLNGDSKNLHYSKDLFVRNVFFINMEHRAVTAMPLGSSKNVFFKLRLHARGQVPAISVLPGDRYLADATQIQLRVAGCNFWRKPILIP